MHLELWYQRIWGTVNIALGIIFSVIFILGAVVLNDPSLLFYLILTGGNIYFGWVRIKQPCVICDEAVQGSAGAIRVYGIFGQLLVTYTYSHRSEIMVKENRLYQNGKKLKFNSWFTNLHQWEKIKRYYTDGLLPADDLQE